MQEQGKVLEGSVVYGKQLGRTIGFPTANMEAGDSAWESPGVYYGRCELDGKHYRVIVNIGKHPTAAEGAPTVEAHLIGFDGDLYGRVIRVELVKYLRSERRFDSLQELKMQLKRDQEQAMRLPL